MRASCPLSINRAYQVFHSSKPIVDNKHSSDDKARTLQQIAEAIEKINDTRIQSNIAASMAVLAGLVLEKELIKRLLRSDSMRESVIYQDILQEIIPNKNTEKLPLLFSLAFHLVQYGGNKPPI